MAILAVVDDLLFRAKLEAAAEALGVTLHICTDAPTPPAPPNPLPWDRVLIDLNVSACDPLEVVRAIRARDAHVPIVGYCAHVEAALRDRALQAGCSLVLARSAFVQRIPELLRDPG